MFLARHTKETRAHTVRRYQRNDEEISLLLAAVNFEWTVSRAVLFLGQSPTADLRARMERCSSLDAYKELWKSEVMAARQSKPLANVVRNWSSVRQAFVARNGLVHGRRHYTRKQARPHIDSLLEGACYVDDYCKSLGYPLYDRMPVRRKKA
jgi:hypothetical protein